MSDNNWHQRAKLADLTPCQIINGKTLPCQPEPDSEENVIEKHAPRDGRLLYRLSEGNIDDVNAAVISAREAFNQGRWTSLSLQQRAAVLTRLIKLVEEQRETLALYECLDVGKPISNALGDIHGVVARLRSAIELATQQTSVAANDGSTLTYRHYKPLGVVGAIVAWNFPLMMVAGKIGPALMMGNSVVVKASEFTALGVSRLAELALEAGVPAGVFNVVQGAGHSVGSALSSHPDIDLIAFVGSSATGKQVMAAAGQSNMKRVLMECGGKSPFIVFDDCPDDLTVMAQRIVGAAFQNQGENCMAGSRLLIQEGIRDRLLPLVIEKAGAIRAADPFDADASFGALINEAHRDKVLAYIDSGLADGGALLLDGRVDPSSLPVERQGGFYLQPTIIDGVHPEATIAQEEIFGPVLTVHTFAEDDDAIALANNTTFGLAGFAATTNLARAQRLVQELDCGRLFIYGSNTTCGSVPTLGATKFKQSGIGDKEGLEGLREFTNATTAVFMS